MGPGLRADVYRYQPLGRRSLGRLTSRQKIRSGSTDCVLDDIRDESRKEQADEETKQGDMCFMKL